MLGNSNLLLDSVAFLSLSMPEETVPCASLLSSSPESVGGEISMASRVADLSACSALLREAVRFVAGTSPCASWKWLVGAFSAPSACRSLECEKGTPGRLSGGGKG